MLQACSVAEWNGSDQSHGEGGALPAGAGLPGGPAGSRDQHLQPHLPPQVLAHPHSHLPLGASPGPAQPLPLLYPGQAGHHALVRGPCGLQRQSLLV